MRCIDFGKSRPGPAGIGVAIIARQHLFSILSSGTGPSSEYGADDHVSKQSKLHISSHIFDGFGTNAVTQKRESPGTKIPGENGTKNRAQKFPG